jgi:hypothetical protein
MSTLVIAVVLTALVFDFTNGFHDTANAMATSIATGALRPRVAVVLAGVLNLLGAFLSVQVALTISSGLVDEARITPAVIFGGLVGAILWNLVTWLLGLPSSSSHALFGGLIGATWVVAGTGAINFSTVAGKVLLPLALSPVVAGVVALSATWIAYRIAARGDRRTITSGFARAQIVSASMIALAHGTNDAQKTMGVITLTLITVGLLPAHSAPPLWVVVAAGLAIAAGHGHGRLADHPHAGAADQRHREPAGLRGRDGQRRGDPQRCAPGVRPVHHSGGVRGGPRLGRRPARRSGALACGGPDGGRLAADPAGGGHGGRARGLGRRPRDRGNGAGRRRAGRRLRRHLRAVPAHARHRSHCHRSHRLRAARTAHPGRSRGGVREEST